MKKLKSIKLPNKQQTIIILVSIFLMMLVLNLLTPLLADDYSYSLNLDKTKINSLMDVVNYQWWHYFNWGGRTVAHTIAQFFLLFPKVVFSIANSIIYVALIYLMYLHIRGNREDKPLFLLLIHLGLWFILPVFGQTCLWLIGSCNYLWTTVIILWFLWIYRKNKENLSIIKLIGIFLLGILAGWTNENTSAGLLVILLCYLIMTKIPNKKEKISKLRIVGFFGALIGFAIMILAPGNYIRAEEIQDNTFILIKIIKRAVEMTITAEKYLFPLIILIVIAMSIKIYHKKKIQNDSYIFIIGSGATIYSMVLSPTFPERSWTGVIVFLLIASGILLYDLDKLNKIYKYIIVDFCIVLSVMYISEYISTGIDINNLRNTWEYREQYIEKQKEKENTEIKLSPYYTGNNHNPTYGLSDIVEDKDIWPNNDLADYFNVKSIQAQTE